LFIWLLGFVLDDLARIKGPELESFRRARVAEADDERLKVLNRQIADVQSQIAQRERTQAILRTSMDGSRATMNQLIELHRLNLEKNVTPTPEEQSALAESETLYLQNQRRFQEANAEIAGLNEDRRTMEDEVAAIRERIREAEEPAREEFEAASRRHRLRVATLQFAFLLPVFLGSAWLTARWRETPYRPLLYAALAAASWKIGVVMHQHAPARFFKYVAITAGIAIVLAFLVRLIRLLVAPRRDWLLKQYREAYKQHRCPMCGDPIRRGPLRHAAWGRKGPHFPPGAVETAGPEGPYTCPACGSPLFVACESCSVIRHALLPFCEACGAERPLGAEAGSAPAAP